MRSPETLRPIIQTLATARRDCPTAWGLLLGEIRAGHRRFVGVQRGDNYQRLLAHFGEGSYDDPEAHGRTLTGLISPLCPGRVESMVNVVSIELSADAGDWSVPRILSMIATLQGRGRQPQDFD